MLLLTGSGRVAVEDVAVDAAEWAASHGLVVGAPSADGERLVAHAPLSLLPTPFPRAAFEQARNVQTRFNLLMHRASKDHAFLRPIVDEYARTGHVPMTRAAHRRCVEWRRSIPSRHPSARFTSMCCARATRAYAALIDALGCLSDLFSSSLALSR